LGRAAAQAAVDKAVPLAVQAAVAQKEGELAAQKALLQEAEAEKGRLALKAGLWRGVGEDVSDSPRIALRQWALSMG